MKFLSKSFAVILVTVIMNVMFTNSLMFVVDTEASQFSQSNAIEKAYSYLDCMSFSRDGLIRQLEFEGYSHADAVYATDYVARDIVNYMNNEQKTIEYTVDLFWTMNAYNKANDYLNCLHFSKQGLIKQLSVAEKFTLQQATAAVNALEIDWNRQAYLKALDYLKYSAFSEERMISQLKFEGFTDLEIDYAIRSLGY